MADLASALATLLGRPPAPRDVALSRGDVDLPSQYETGNIDLYHRPHVKNPDGSISTVRSMSFEDNGNEILVPTVVGNRVVSDEDAIAEYRRSGQHLGKFASPQAATKYASQLHDDYAAGKYDAPSLRSLKGR